MFTSMYRRYLPTIALTAGLAACAGQQSAGGGLTPDTTGFAHQTQAVSFDSVQPDTGSLIFTANRDSGGSVLAFKTSASGNVSPAVTIAGPHTLLNSPDALAIDALGRIYTANDGANQVEVFGKFAHGNVKPLWTVGGSNSQLGPTEGLMIDHSGNLWATDYANNAVTEYAPGAKGNVSPINVIQGSNTQLSTPTGMAMNGSGQLYVASVDGPSIEVFAKGASGNATPIGVIGGSNTGLVRPFALAFDNTGRLLVADEYAGIIVFASGAMGNVSPVQMILGLAYPAGVAADKQNNIWAADFTGNSIDEYAANANGYATPIRSIAGPATTLSGACFLVFR